MVKSFKASEYGRLMTEDESAILKQLMTDVVEEGTASKLRGLNYTAAGKTGSAEYNKSRVTAMPGLPVLLPQKTRKSVSPLS